MACGARCILTQALGGCDQTRPTSACSSRAARCVCLKAWRAGMPFAELQPTTLYQIDTAVQSPWQAWQRSPDSGDSRTACIPSPACRHHSAGFTSSRLWWHSSAAAPSCVDCLVPCMQLWMGMVGHDAYWPHWSPCRGPAGVGSHKRSRQILPSSAPACSCICLREF